MGIGIQRIVAPAGRGGLARDLNPLTRRPINVRVGSLPTSAGWRAPRVPVAAPLHRNRSPRFYPGGIAGRDWHPRRVVCDLDSGRSNGAQSARASHCAGNLKNIGIALTSFHALRRSYPAGSELLAGTEQAWSSRILPFLELETTAVGIDYNSPWNAPGSNLIAANQNLSIYLCPSAVIPFPGKQDYGGIIGTSLLPIAAGVGPNQAFGCGTLIVTSVQQPVGVTAAKITDGLSTTLCVGESVDRQDESSSRWACGRNCFAQTEQWVNMDTLGSLHSNHPGGAQGLFADGHVQFLSDEIAPTVLGAICTRNGGETETFPN